MEDSSAAGSGSNVAGSGTAVMALTMMLGNMLFKHKASMF
jgi:hypothetical protein